ncbi:hypothetical protein Glove_117g65 [Diversispora epigaea]|uniref:TLDc domain-containing protein n=1 Tax=Diversispora epigaea TaxID=1348612 RepID=A0A397J003_9GLOM|nr:hypothetical protein Glove_117g65 [Diversispora epigaea]
MFLNFFDKLSQNLIELLNDGDDYNPNENNIKIIIKSSISAQIFNVILQYIYGGIIDLENCETRFIYDLMLASDEFELKELTNKLETLLIETKGSWLRTHFSYIYHFIFNRNDFKKLKNFCNDIVVKYPNLIFDADDFTSFEESALWGVAQISTLPTNIDDWTKENFFTLKITLQQCLPHIHYFHLSGIEVLDKIEPYKKIFDKQLWKDINHHLIAPERPVESTILPPRSVLVRELPPRAEEPKESFSTIISEEHAAEISTWIDHGFAPQTFWNICHGHACTVVLVKVKETDEIIGGYNPLTWVNNNIKGQWVKTKDSFIFSLKNGDI